MATTVRISALPADLDPTNANSLPVDDGSTVRRVTLPALMESNAAKSSIIASAKDGNAAAPDANFVARPIGNKLLEWISPEDFGGVASSDPLSAVDSTTALAKTFSVSAALGRPVRLNGFYASTAPITVSNVPLAVWGDASEACGVVFTASDGFVIDMSGVTTVRRPTVFRDMSVLTTNAGLYTGVKYTGRRGVQYAPQFEFKGATVAGATHTSSSYWNVNIDLIDAGESVLRDYSISGGGDAARSSVGVRMAGSKVVDILCGIVFNCDDAWTATDDTEGVNFIGNAVLACVNGLVSYNNVGNQFNLDNNHFAVAVSAVILGADRTGTANSGSNHSFITNNFPLVYDLPDHMADEFIAFDIASDACKIIGNEVLRTTSTRTRRGVRLRAGTNRGASGVPSDNIIVANNFNSMTTGVTLDAGVERTTIGPNRGVNSRANMIVDNSANNSNRVIFADDTGFGHLSAQHDYLSRDSGASLTNPIARIVHPSVGTAIENWLEMRSAIAGAPATLAAGSANNPHIRFLPNNAGVVMIQLGNCPSYADDVAAAAGGVPVGGIYRTASALKIRIA